MFPFVSFFRGGGKGKPLRLLKKGSAEKAACFRKIHPGPWGRLSSGKAWTRVGVGGMRPEGSGLACYASGRGQREGSVLVKEGLDVRCVLVEVCLRLANDEERAFLISWVICIC